MESEIKMRKYADRGAGLDYVFCGPDIRDTNTRDSVLAVALHDVVIRRRHHSPLPPLAHVVFRRRCCAAHLRMMCWHLVAHRVDIV